MADCRECKTELPAGAVRCAACGKRQNVDPSVVLLLAVIAAAVVIGYLLMSWS